MQSDPPRCRVKLEEGVFEGVVQLHDGGLVPAPVAVVGGREDGDDVPVVRPVVALHHELVSSANQGQTIRMVECLRYVLKTEALDVTSAVQFVQIFLRGQFQGEVVAEYAESLMVLRLPGRKCIQLHEVRCPSLPCRQGRTTGGRTWVLREEPPGVCPGP